MLLVPSSTTSERFQLLSVVLRMTSRCFTHNLWNHACLFFSCSSDSLASVTHTEHEPGRG